MHGLFGFLGRLRPRLGRIAGIAVSLLVVAGFAFVLLQIASGGPLAHSIVGDDPTATIPLIQYETPTPTPLDAPPTATYYVPGNATATPPLANVPFHIDQIPGAEVSCGLCGTEQVTWGSNETRICYSQESFEGDSHLHVANGAPGGTATYRWISDLGPLTPVITVKLERGDGSNIDPPNNLVDHWSLSSALGNGARHWVQVEVLTPNHILSPRAWFELVCQTSLEGGAGVTPGIVNYDCTGPDAQTFTFNASVDLLPGPPTFTLAYHWLHKDGSVSPTYTDAIPGGVDRFALHSDTITVTADQLSPATYYTDTLVSDSSTLPATNGIGNVSMPCCTGPAPC